MDLNPAFDFKNDDRWFPLHKPNEKDYNFEEDVIYRLVRLEDRYKTMSEEVFYLRMTLTAVCLIGALVAMLKSMGIL